MVCVLDGVKPVYFIGEKGELRESFPDENGNWDDETELWRDSQVSSGWMGTAYQVYSDMGENSAVPKVHVVDDEKDDGTAVVCSDAPAVRGRARSRSRNRTEHKLKQ